MKRDLRSRLIIDFLNVDFLDEFRQAVKDKTGSERDMSRVIRDFCKKYISDWKRDSEK